MANPFAARFFRPGQVPFFETAEVSLAGLGTALATHAGWGQIVGRHGSGKSTLLHHLSQQLSAEGKLVPG